MERVNRNLKVWTEWSRRRDLNPRPSDYKSDALPTELRRRIGMERGTGIEPATNSVEGCDSTVELPPPCLSADTLIVAATASTATDRRPSRTPTARRW